ncbi:MAG: hypothetical protein M3R00_04100 [Pseudomonadota bacterium]|nr:hypothetical protein [Pseudomonadota bacterium]
MKRILLPLVAVSSLFGYATAQSAIPVTRYDAYIVEVPQYYAAQGGYFGFNLGVNLLYAYNTHPVLETDNASIAFSGTRLPDINVSSKAGEYIALTTGYRIYGFRFEGELAYRHNNISRIQNLFSATQPPPAFPDNITPLSNQFHQGDNVTGALMLNLYYDRYYTSGWMWMIGLGIGYSLTYYDAEIMTEAQPVNFTGTTTNPAGQIILGFAYRWNPGLETGLTYRLFAKPAGDYNVRGRNGFDDGAGFGNVPDTWTISFSPKYITNTISLEFRFT